jgi:hypothetical protein
MARSAPAPPFRAAILPVVATETRRDVVGALASMLAASAGAAAALRLWRADLGVPFLHTGGDATFYQALVKGIVDHGWFLRNPDLGAPLGLELHDFPHGADNLNFLLIRLLGLFTTDSAAVMNLFLLLTFPLTALAAFLVLRRLGVSRASAVVCSALFSLLPYHFVRGEGHLLLSSYAAVPVGAYLALAVLADEPLFAVRSGARGWRRLATGRSVATVALCALVASSGAYYAVFTLVLVLCASLIRLAVGGERRAIATGGAVAALVAVILAANLSPSLVYRLRHGPNPEAAERVPLETEVFGLRLTNLLLPVDDHRLGPLARAKASYNSSTPLPDERAEAAQTLGLVGTAGFGWLLAVALTALAGDRRVGTALERRSALLVLVGLLFATTSGLSTLVAYGITPQLHAWARMSIFIAFFSLLVAGLLLDRLGRRLGSTRAGASAFAAVLAAVVVGGALDQTTDSYVPLYSPDAREYADEGRFVRRIEAVLPAGAAVYQLPYVPFPEANLGGTLEDYDLLRPYVQSERLRWSFGAMKGRDADWAAQLADEPLAAQLAGAAAAGFGGAYVDRKGYADGARAVERELERLLGAHPIESRDGRLLFFDLRPEARRLAAGHDAAAIAELRTATLEPVRLEDEDEASVTLRNPSSEPRRVTVVSGTTAREIELAPGQTRVPLTRADGSRTRVLEDAFEPFRAGAS